MASVVNIPYPSQLRMSGDNIAAEWKRFSNYEVATDLESKASAKRAAVFLSCIGTEAYEAFQSMEFAAEEGRTNIERSWSHSSACAWVKSTSPLNRRIQDVGETFDLFLSDLRRLVRSCEYGALEDSILHDRIVIGIRDDATRLKLLQTRNLTLNSAIDVQGN